MSLQRPCASYFKVGILTALLFGCSTPRHSEFNQPASSPLSMEQQQLKHSLMQVYAVWQGAPYRLGGTSINGVDCSAFVQVTYQQALGYRLPRTTKDQVKVGDEISYQQANVGDLVFFKTAPKVRHVGVYLGNKQFMHASTSKGVIISRLDNPYWASKYWHVRRVRSSPEI
ncbi:hydrolase [Vibrio sp. JPW-9-11-11]|uniref:NlpC/P60 family protein n=1 Tax=Vibrio sp. JPW-9-11-11 TaxID=1416532 RepID=UPI0015930777|nr:NlpC/P60 family protein [Vibrio sp. JPW-9-11-11]NVD06699.1 hydrolase [Vibrio sp. JPW-9-11-11]